LSGHERRLDWRWTSDPTTRHLGDAILSSTLQGIITSWNPSTERMDVHSNEQVAGKSGSLLTPGLGVTNETKVILASISAGHSGQHSELMHSAGRMAFAVSITVSPMRDAHGTVDGPGHCAFDAAPLVLERPPSNQVS
jgi:PAS domain S-box-containing protein